MLNQTGLPKHLNRDATVFLSIQCTIFRATKPTFLIHPKCGFYQHFSRLVVFMSVLSAVVAMYLQAFTEGPASGPFEVSRTLRHYILFPLCFYISDFVYVIHIVLQFFVPFPTVEGKFCKERKRICYRLGIAHKQLHRKQCQSPNSFAGTRELCQGSGWMFLPQFLSKSTEKP